MIYCVIFLTWSLKSNNLRGGLRSMPQNLQHKHGYAFILSSELLLFFVSCLFKLDQVLVRRVDFPRNTYVYSCLIYMGEKYNIRILFLLLTCPPNRFYSEKYEIDLHLQSLSVVYGRPWSPSWPVGRILYKELHKNKLSILSLTMNIH